MPRPKRTPGARTLVCGYGNPGRSDDGLGPALVSRLEADPRWRRRKDLVTEARLQLNIEDSLAVSEFDRVIFVDAARRGPEPCAITGIKPAAGWSFSTHALSPQVVLGLCLALYGRAPRAEMLAIRGHRWGLGERLSAKAAENLAQALRFLERHLRRPSALHRRQRSKKRAVARRVQAPGPNE